MKTLFIRLPVGAQREIEYGCECPTCKLPGANAPRWDTLGIELDKDGVPVGKSWTVHYPNMQGEYEIREGRGR